QAAATLALRYPENEEIQRTATIVQTYAALKEESRQGLAVIQARTAEVLKANEADDERLARLKQMVALAQAPRDERPEVRARAIPADIQDPEARLVAADLQAQLKVGLSLQEQTRIADRAATELEQVFLDLATSGKVNFASLASSFTRAVFTMLVEAGDLKKVL